MKILLFVQLFFIVCNAGKCPKNKWNCYISGECILLNNVCNGYNHLDCKYGEDENYIFCLKWNPKHNLLTTSTTATIFTTYTTVTGTISTTDTTVTGTTSSSTTITDTTATTGTTSTTDITYSSTTITDTTYSSTTITDTTATTGTTSSSTTVTTTTISKKHLVTFNDTLTLKNKSLFVKRKTYIYIIIILIQLIIIIVLFLKLRKKKEIYINNVYLEPTKLNEMYNTMPEYETVL